MPDVPHIEIVRSRRRSLALQVQPDGSVVVKAPLLVPRRFIDKFLNEHKDWIEKHVTKVQAAVSAKAEGGYLYLGKRLTLEPGNYTQIKVDGENLLMPQSLLFRREKELSLWYKKEAARVITGQVEKYAILMKTSYKEITFSDTKTQWGRCSHDNRLQFSWRLVMAPPIVLNYVVVHELAHTMEKNHSQLFWMKVRNFNPSYRQQIKWLKDFGTALHI